MYAAVPCTQIITFRFDRPRKLHGLRIRRFKRNLIKISTDSDRHSAGPVDPPRCLYQVSTQQRMLLADLFARKIVLM